MRRIQSKTADTELLFSHLRLSHRVAELQRFQELLKLASEMTPARTTIRQLYAFSIIAQANARGSAITLADVKERGEPYLAQHLNRSYQLFLSADQARDLEALNWIDPITDPSDRRQRHLVLTDQGKEACEIFANIMLGANDEAET